VIQELRDRLAEAHAAMVAQAASSAADAADARVEAEWRMQEAVAYAMRVATAQLEEGEAWIAEVERQLATERQRADAEAAADASLPGIVEAQAAALEEQADVISHQDACIRDFRASAAAADARFAALREERDDYAAALDELERRAARVTALQRAHGDELAARLERAEAIVGEQAARIADLLADDAALHARRSLAAAAAAVEPGAAAALGAAWPEEDSVDDDTFYGAPSPYRSREAEGAAPGAGGGGSMGGAAVTAVARPHGADSASSPAPPAYSGGSGEAAALRALLAQQDEAAAARSALMDFLEQENAELRARVDTLTSYLAAASCASHGLIDAVSSRGRAEAAAAPAAEAAAVAAAEAASPLSAGGGGPNTAAAFGRAEEAEWEALEARRGAEEEEGGAGGDAGSVLSEALDLASEASTDGSDAVLFVDADACTVRRGASISSAGRTPRGSPAAARARRYEALAPSLFSSSASDSSSDSKDGGGGGVAGAADDAGDARSSHGSDSLAAASEPAAAPPSDADGGSDGSHCSITASEAGEELTRLNERLGAHRALVYELALVLRRREAALTDATGALGEAREEIERLKARAPLRDELWRERESVRCGGARSMHA